MKPIRIILADDHTLVRAGINSLLKQISYINVIAEADNGRKALQLTKELKPDIVLMDIAMREMNGLESTSRLTKELPEVRVIILSMYANEEYVLKAFNVGASGYLLKDAAASELEIAIKEVSHGKTYVSPSVSKHLINAYRSPKNSKKDFCGKLTPRQREVLQLIAEGKTTKEIAFTLNLSVKTVETHRAQLMQRLDIYDIPGLVRYAISNGVIEV